MSIEPSRRAEETGYRVLHVDDDEAFADIAATYLSREGDVEVHTEHAAADGLAHLEGDARVDCIVSDYQMPGLDGLEFLDAVRETHPDLPFVLFTGKGSEEIASDAISAGVTDYLEKGTGEETFELLANRVREAVRSHRTEERLDRMRDRYRRLVEQNVAGIYIMQDREFEYVNPRMAEMFGYEQAELLELDRQNSVVAPEDRGKVERYIREREGGDMDGIQYTFRGRRKDGERIHVEAHGSRIEYEGEPAIIGIAVDVTDRVERERTLERYERIVSTMPDGVYVTDAEGRYVAVNDAIVDASGYDRAELVGSDASVLLDDEALATVEAAVRDLLRGDADTARAEVEVETADGDRFPTETRLTLRPGGDDGEFTGTIGVVRDISERRARQRALERERERHETFASMVSHDLRSPLSVARGYLDVAEESGDPDDFARARDALDRMDALVEDLLALAREGRAVGDPEPVDLVAVAQDAWQCVETGDATLSTPEPATGRADRGRLRTLFENLFRNAVEHGGDGVSVRVEVTDDGFAVADDGPGVPPDERDRVFEYGFTTSRGGTGLGLAIVEEVAEAHGWSVAVGESEAGGARVTVSGVDVP